MKDLISLILCFVKELWVFKLGIYIMFCLVKVLYKKNFDLWEIEFFSCLNVVFNNIWNGKYDKIKVELKIVV